MVIRIGTVKAFGAGLFCGFLLGISYKEPSRYWSPFHILYILFPQWNSCSYFRNPSISRNPSKVPIIILKVNGLVFHPIIVKPFY